jgi:hypothetical protein
MKLSIKKQNALSNLFLALSLTACLTDPPSKAPMDPTMPAIPQALIDPCSKAEIGVEDPDNGDYLFDDGRVLARGTLIVESEASATCDAQCWQGAESGCLGCCDDSTGVCWERCPSYAAAVADKRKQSLYIPE